jgi:hypothetical protein
MADFHLRMNPLPKDIGWRRDRMLTNKSVRCSKRSRAVMDVVEVVQKDPGQHAARTVLCNRTSDVHLMLCIPRVGSQDGVSECSKRWNRLIDLFFQRNRRTLTSILGKARKSMAADGGLKDSMLAGSAGCTESGEMRSPVVFAWGFAQSCV